MTIRTENEISLIRARVTAQINMDITIVRDLVQHGGDQLQRACGRDGASDHLAADPEPAFHAHRQLPPTSSSIRSFRRRGEQRLGQDVRDS
jgi:hypothetical protein